MRTFSIISIFFLLNIALMFGQDSKRPPIWGISKMTFLVSDFEIARDFYGQFLGFSEAFSYNSNLGKVLSFKVNDRQFIEFVEDKQAKEKKRLISYSLETANVEQMLSYLKSKGVTTPYTIQIDGAGNKCFQVVDPWGNGLEFMSFAENGKHAKTKGKFLTDKRISKRIQHAGIYSPQIIDNDPFYVGILGFKELVRYPEDKTLPATIQYLYFDDCTENIEFYSPNDHNVSHPCFVSDDMQETVYKLKSRNTNHVIGKVMIGKGKRWLMNMWNADKTRVEFTEIHCVK
jgi:catechol 2,3-dioxygenase-like lactoylglutathione lyase family enzyme